VSVIGIFLMIVLFIREVTNQLIIKINSEMIVDINTGNEKVIVKII